ncbi:tetratricopeptide repeat protein [Dactylosporangium sp. AC04546]|uniref:tetratricopeptide repeat protein n=1 Tax=Dactylosporangium sp. AC04546 TaxID=2862460 RepID=UPI001EE0DB27|nr:tetratricopeptide repeat protein [Dactylosporangium sp. AC04546]WVK82917.1 tetratricopeptide repeat protein [Dactylosporangium sp. AC04546]
MLEERWEEALTDSEQALLIQRTFCNSDPLVQLPVLIEVLNGHSAVLAGLGRLDEAVATAEESVGVGRWMVEGDRPRFRFSLALALHEPP